MARKILAYIIWIVYRLLSSTWKVQTFESEKLKQDLKDKRPFVLAHFHGDELVLIPYIGLYKIATISSTSKDGEMMNTIIHLVGGVTTRGSSTRGAVQALKGLIRLAREGYNTSFAVDGPKGPLYKVKPGVFELSRLVKGNIYYAGVSCDRAWTFPKSWNKTYLPKPFARIFVDWNGPFLPSKDEELTEPRSPHLAEELESALHGARSAAQKKLV